MNSDSVMLERNITILTGGGYDDKLVADFVYVFDIKDYKIINMKENDLQVLQEKKSSMVLCTYNKKEYMGILKNVGLKYRKDYIVAEDLFTSMDLDIAQVYKKVYVYVGAEKIKDRLYFYAQLYMILHHICKERFTKSRFRVVRNLLYAWMFIVESFFNSKIVLCRSLDAAVISENDCICVNNNRTDIDKLTYHEGIVNKHNVYTTKELESLCFVSELLRKTYLDQRQNKCGCTLPFEMFYINPFGEIHLCPCFMELNIGNLIRNSATDVWISPIARVLRLSVINNTYTFCDRRCKEFWKNKDIQELLPRKEIEVLDYPAKMMVAFDKACNLRCKSCRSKPYVKNSPEGEKNIMFYADAILQSGWLGKCEELTIGGDGETFLSNGYKRILFSEASTCRKKVAIMTNGTLFTPKIWEQLQGKYEYIRMNISIDAASGKTYKKIRGGNFEQLMKNMDFLSTLRRTNQVNYVVVNMIVQRDNYKEMKDFILWAKRLGFDSAYLSPIWNWGTYSEKEFRDISIFIDAEETKMKPDVEECLRDEIFLDPIVTTRWAR